MSKLQHIRIQKVNGHYVSECPRCGVAGVGKTPAAAKKNGFITGIFCKRNKHEVKDVQENQK